MSEEVSTKQIAREQLTAPAPIQPWSAESEADKLMDDLFSDIDRILEGGTKLPTEPAKPEYVSLQSIVIPSITTSEGETRAPEEEQKSGIKPVDEAKSGELLQTNESPTVSSEAKSSSWSWEKLLWTVGLVSLAATLLLLLVSQDRRTWLQLKLSKMGVLPAQKTQLSESDAQFIQYALRSLNVIERKTEANKKKTKATDDGGNPKQPPVAGAGNQSSAPSQSTTILEKTVYYPVYPPQVPPATTAPSAPANSPPKVSPPKVSPQAIAPVVPVAPVVPAASATPATPANTDTEAPKSELPPAPAAQHALVGLIKLETPERSAALFSINGVTQRFKVGEAIGTSGWTLVSVNNNEAIIRRNGEVRSVYIGQQF